MGKDADNGELSCGGDKERERRRKFFCRMLNLPEYFTWAQIAQVREPTEIKFLTQALRLPPSCGIDDIYSALILLVVDTLHNGNLKELEKSYNQIRQRMLVY